MNTTVSRSRWAAIGAAVAVTFGAGGIGVTQAVTETGERPVFLPIEPCRLADLRPDPDTVGERSDALTTDETYTLSGWGDVGECELPTDTTALALNVTAIGATEPTFIALFPADATDVPNASSLNPVPGQPATPNAVDVDLDASGNFSIYNLQGEVSVIVDVVGVYDDHTHDDRYYTEAEVDDRLLFAVVEPATDVAEIVRGSGASSVTKIDDGYYSVKFDRDVSTCAWTASYGEPDNAGVGALFTNVRGGPLVEEVRVVIWDTGGNRLDGDGFHVVVICP